MRVADALRLLSIVVSCAVFVLSLLLVSVHAINENEDSYAVAIGYGAKPNSMTSIDVGCSDYCLGKPTLSPQELGEIKTGERVWHATVFALLVFANCAAIAFWPQQARVAMPEEDDALPPELEEALRDVEPLKADEEDGGGCSVCMENRASICFVPCRHQTLCDDCTEDWWYAKPAAQAEWHCPICRAVIEHVVRPIK